MNTVIIGCKTPNGILMQVPGVDREVFIKGWNKSELIGGHGITHNVPQDLWEAWRILFKDHPLLTNGLIFAHAEEKSTKAEAKEKKGTKSKMEQLDQLEKTDKPNTVGAVDKE